MKKILALLFLCTFLSQTSNAQLFTTLETDSTGDATIGPDLRRLSYGIDVSQDSIWFKIETVNAITANDGFMIGLDTNQSTMDGDAWKVGTIPTARMYDHALFVAYDFATATILEVSLGRVNSNSVISANIALIDTNVLVFSTRLSLLDGNKRFNLLCGAGAFDIGFTGSTIDQLPETGYLTINANTASVNNIITVPNLAVYPNPTSHILNWDNGLNLPNATMLTIYNTLGEKVMQTLYTNGELNIKALSNGVYFVQCGNAVSQFIKQ